MRVASSFVQVFWGITFLCGGITGQPLNRQEFFEDDAIVSLHLSANLKNIDLEKQKDVKRPGMAKIVLQDGREFSGPIELHGRGKLRFEYCDPPPLMLYFKTKQPGALKPLGKLKLVWPCKSGEFYEQLVLKEYLIYKMYNLLTPLSFRVRLLDVQFTDSSKSAGLLQRKGFLIEDIDELARRNDCREYEDTVLMPAETDQRQYALVTVFQYMIANTDWSVSNYQNIKMVVPDTARQMVPLIVPYDFDNSGLVNTDYAAPHESLPIESVRQRYNKGMSLKTDDIRAVAQRFAALKPAFYSLIEQCKDLEPAHKKEMVRYLNEFFVNLTDEKRFHKIFFK